MINKCLVIGLSLFLLSGIALSAQVNLKVNTDFEDKIQGWMSEKNVPAVSVCIIEEGKIKYVKSFGELQKGFPAPDNAIFNLASMTKPVAAMLVLKLVEADQWSLDEPLYHYWVDPDVANDPRHKKLTTRHVLYHQTGFENWRSNEDNKKLKFNFEPGTKFFYSGEGFEYLRKAIQNKFNIPFDKLVDSLIVKPAGMTSTQYWNESLDMSRFAYPHNSKGEKYIKSYKSKVGAANNLLSTAEDYCKFLIYVMNNGAGLSQNLFNEMIDPKEEMGENRGRSLAWLAIKDLPNEEYCLNHGGSNNGIKNQALILPKSKRGIVILTNGDNGFALGNDIIKASFAEGEEIVNAIYGLSPRKVVPVGVDVLERYTGSWIDNTGNKGRKHKIVAGDGVLKFSGEGVPSVTLYPESEKKFFLKNFDVQFDFATNDSLVLISGGNIDWTAKKVKPQPEIKSQLDSNKIKDLRQHMDSIASNATEGRLTASSGYKKAAQYAVGVYRKAGLDSCYIDKKGNKSYYQPVPFMFNDYGSSSLTIQKKGVNKSYKHTSGGFVFLEAGKMKNIRISSTVFIGYGISEPELRWDDFEGLDVKGKWVIVKQGLPNNDDQSFPESLRKKYAKRKPYDSLQLAVLIKHKVAGLIVLPNKKESQNWEYMAFRNFRYKNIHYAEDEIKKSKSPFPIVLINPKLAQILMEGEAYNPIANKGSYHSYVLDDTKISATVICENEFKNCNNIVAIVPGTDVVLKQEYITVGAHLDHIGKIGNKVYNGANDDASGCVILLEAAKAIAENPLKRSVLFVLYTSEEQQLIGSRHFLEHPPVPIEQISLNINIEQIGSKNRDYQGIWAIGLPQFKESFQKASMNYAKTNYKFDMLEKYSDALKGSVDSWSYHQKGIPIVLLSSGGFPEHHTLKDNIDLIDFEHLLTASTFLNSFITELGDK